MGVENAGQDNDGLKHRRTLSFKQPNNNMHRQRYVIYQRFVIQNETEIQEAKLSLGEPTVLPKIVGVT